MEAQTSAFSSAAFSQKVLTTTVVVGALGYFVDVYDLALFSIVRVPSLQALGIQGADLLNVGARLLNIQMIGMLVGGIVWGILGDKKGRVSVLFGSILLYALANIANAFVTSVEVYGFLRFIAGFGLAGELGAAITLVTETLPVEKRGYGTLIVAMCGVMGGIAAGLVGDLLPWNHAYIIGGALGVVLLILRMRMAESGMFSAVKHQDVRKGDLTLILFSRVRLKKYIYCAAVGIPIWFIIGTLATFAPEFGKVLGATEPIQGSRAIMFCYIGLAIGDLVSGFMSQVLKSRKKVVFAYLALALVSIIAYLFTHNHSALVFYGLITLLGFAGGYWAVFVTMAAEQFGTNLRSTVATSVPNFVRGAVVPAIIAFQAMKPSLGIVYSALVIGLILLTIATLSLAALKESYSNDLNYLEVS